MITTIVDLQNFLIAAPFCLKDNKIASEQIGPKTISCIWWNENFYITGTDIIKIIVFKFNLIKRPVVNMKKMEEGIYSDLRQYPGIIENPKSKFIDYLFKNSCLRSRKKQKVFYWDQIDHALLFINALNRDLRREVLNQTPCSIPTKDYCPNLILEKIFGKFDAPTQ
jgi:transcription factor STE12